jgi:hypothetical protein
MTDPVSSRASRRALRRACRRDYPPRGLHLIDVENLAGTATPDPAQARHLLARYLLLVGVGAWDHVVIASSHLALKTAGCWWPGARYLVRSGPDGADLALVDLAGHEHIAERFSQVTIASGDGIFAPVAASLAVAGCQVSVISRRIGLSRQLALAVGWKVTYIDPPGTYAHPSAACPPRAV